MARTTYISRAKRDWDAKPTMVVKCRELVRFGEYGKQTTKRFKLGRVYAGDRFSPSSIGLLQRCGSVYFSLSYSEDSGWTVEYDGATTYIRRWWAVDSITMEV